MTILEWLNGLSVSEINFATTYIATSKSYPMTNNGREHHGFIYAVKGIVTYHLEDKAITVVPNSVVYLPKGSKYKITLVGEECLVIYVDFELNPPQFNSPFCIKFNDDKTIMTLFSDLEKYWKQKSSDSLPISKSIFYNICALMIRKGETYMNSDGYAKIAKSLNYLHSHYTEKDFRIEKLYEISKVSGCYYGRLFYRRFGQTPKEYILFVQVVQSLY